MSLAYRVADLTAYNQLLEARVKETESRHSAANKIRDDFMKISSACNTVESNFADIRVRRTH